MLTPTQLAGHLSCEHLTQLERLRRNGELKLPFNPDPRLNAMQERGRRHEALYVERLHGEGRNIRDLRATKDPAATLEAMRHGYGAIVQAPLGDAVFHGVADVLLRVETPSALGTYSYQPLDTKLSRETTAGTILQLCTYCELLRSMQELEPVQFHVVSPLGEQHYRTADFAAYFRFVRGRLQAAVAAVPPPQTYPDPVGHCDVCTYWKYCDDRRRKDDHPSLVANIQTGQVRELQRQSVTTLTALAESEGSLPDKPKRGSAETYLRLGHQARLQLQARSRVLPPVEFLPVEPTRGFTRLPEPSPGDIFLDFEGDPFVGEHGLEYLTGFTTALGSALPHTAPSPSAPPRLVRGGEKHTSDRSEYRQLWAFDAAAEKRACQEFIDFATARLLEYPGAHIYHFGAYEPSALKRLCMRYDTHGEQLDRLLRGRRFVDLHAVVREGLRIGVARYGLKELEPLHAFARELDLANAAIARRDLELALELDGHESIGDELHNEVAIYNRDDCLSTASLRDWLEEQRTTLIQRGEEITRPQPGEAEPSDKVRQRDERISAIKQALLADLPAEAAGRSEEHEGRVLLASMLGYFREEEKSAYWEHFRLRELSPDEQLDEREMLSGLRFVEELPKKGREKNARCLYSFPPQDTALDAGDQVYFTKYDDPAPDSLGTGLKAIEVDLAKTTVTLSVGKAAAGRHPSAVFRNQVVGSEALEDSLLAFAEQVREHGFGAEPFTAASALLLRRAPKQGVGTTASPHTAPSPSAPPRLVRGGEKDSLSPVRQPGDATPEVAQGLVRGGEGYIQSSMRRSGESTLDAAKRLYLELDGDVLPIQGPPGSGKTFTGARAIVALAKAGKRVGVTAVSHKVIDNLLTAVRGAAKEEGIGLRLVHKHNEQPPAGIEYVDDADDALSAVARGAVVGGTAWLWANEDATQCLDYLFIDEAGQMALAQALAAARSARNLVLLGDPQQLEQPTKGSHPDGADVAALVHILDKDAVILRDDQGLFLDRTYRLHPRICEFTSELYYEKRLLPSAGLERQQLSGETPFAGAGLLLVEVPHEGNQAQANEEVEAVAEVVRSLLSGTKWTDCEGLTRPLAPNDVLVVAPYNAQVSALRRRLSEFGVERVGTVDKFQGQEAPVVIYSCTSSSAQDAPRGMAFLYDPHRFNVATSRAQGVVIVVASPKLFEPECRTPEQMRWANGLCRYRELAVRVETLG